VLHTIPRACCVPKCQAWDALLGEQVCQVARNGVFKDGEVGGLVVDADVSHPEVGRHETANCRVLHGGALFARKPKANSVEAKQAVANISKPLLDPEPIVALEPKGAGHCLVVGVPSADQALVVDLVDLDDLACAVRDVPQTRLVVDGPYLLTCGRHSNANVGLRIAHEQTERVPRAIDAHPVLVWRDRHGRRNRCYAGQQLVVQRIGDVLLGVFGGEAWREQCDGSEGAYRVEEGAMVSSRRNHGR